MKVTKVLLVDDEVEFTSSLSRVLRRRGVDVAIAGDGFTALPLIAHNEFDVVVLDIKMPGMDGIQVLSEIKRLRPRTQVIMLTGHFSPAMEEESSTGGAYAHLLKPFPVLKLVDMIFAAAEHCHRSE
jgi:DNA-binding NtrC family response regulator